jgi:hypothetical protein
VPFFDPVENPVHRTTAEKWARRCEAIASVVFVLWLIPAAFVEPSVAMVVAVFGVGVSLLIITLGTARTDGKKRETIMVGSLMSVLWFFLLVFSFTERGF